MENKKIEDALKSWDNLHANRAIPSNSLDELLIESISTKKRRRIFSTMQWAAVLLVLLINFVTWFSSSDESSYSDYDLISTTYTLNTFDTQNLFTNEN